jgi:hypothetical protein
MDGTSSKQMFFHNFNSFYLPGLYNVTFLKEFFLFAFIFLCCFHPCSIYILSRLVLRRTVLKNFYVFKFNQTHGIKINDPLDSILYVYPNNFLPIGSL